MHGAAYLRKALLPHVSSTLEDYLWLAAQVPESQLDAVPTGRPASIRAQILDLALDLDVRVYPPLLALLDGTPAPPPADAAARARQRASWAAADLMLAMKQIRYRYQAVEERLTAAPDAAWGAAAAAPTPLALGVFGLWRLLLDRLAALAATVAELN